MHFGNDRLSQTQFDLRQEDDELVTADSGNYICFPQMPLHAISNRVENLVARDMAERVINTFEVVDVNISNREGILVSE